MTDVKDQVLEILSSGQYVYQPQRQVSLVIAMRVVLRTSAYKIRVGGADRKRIKKIENRDGTKLNIDEEG